MNPPIVTQLAHADPNAAPLNLNELIDIFNPLFSSAIQGSYIPYVIGHATPGADDRDKAWIELDSSGRPIAVRTYYNGNWRRVYNGMIGEIRMYSGDPSPSSGVWDTDGHGVIGKEYDGWQICNGKNNSPNLTDKFICAAHMDNSNGHSGYNAGWQTFVDGKSDLKDGGSKDHLIVASDLPPLDSQNGLATLNLAGKGFKEDTLHDNAVVIIDNNYGGARDHSAPIATYGSNPNGNPPVPQSPVPTLPPFHALAFIVFQGYTA